MTDWPSLKAEVRRWQGLAKLGWSDAEVADVARYLNALYYHYASSDWSGASASPGRLN